VRADFITSQEQFLKLRQEWNELLSRSVSDVPFLRHEFVATWWSTLGGGEWPSGDLLILAARGEDGQLVGIAPLFMAKDEHQRNSLMFLGTLEIADYLDLIVRPEHLPGFVELMADSLMGEQAPDWEVLDLHNIPADSPTVGAIEKWSADIGVELTKSILQPCPVIALPSTWDDYLASLHKKQRQELRRKMRNAQRVAGELRLVVVDRQQTLESSIEILSRLMRSDPRKKKFLTEAMKKQFLNMAQVAQEGGWLQLSFLEVDGKAIAGLFSFDYRNRLWIYNSGIDPAFREISPGWVQLGMLIGWAIEHQREALDFLRGDEDYKYRLGGVAQQIVRMTVKRGYQGQISNQ
jgi:CelD/BcsL family acetyltransferase involved in cellulose biosynthesis